MFGILTKLDLLKTYVVGPARNLLKRHASLRDRVPGYSDRMEFAYYHSLNDALRKFVGRQCSPYYAFKVYREYDRYAHEFGRRPQAILELGTGANLGPLFCFLAGGACRVVGVDIQPMTVQPEFYRLLKDYLAVAGGFRVWEPTMVNDNRPGVVYPELWEDVDPDSLLRQIEYHSNVSSSALPFREEFDFIYSTATLEHFDQPAEAVAKIYLALQPGGLTAHGIDLRNHIDWNDPLGHLRWSEEEYSRRTRKYGGGQGLEQILQGTWEGEVYCNRLLASDWQRLFQETGFELLDTKIICLLDPNLIDRQKLAPPYRERQLEELSPLSIVIIAQKPKN